MPEFVLLIRTHGMLPADRFAQRAAAVRAWALAQQQNGTLVDVARLEDAGTVIAPDGRAAPIATVGPVASVMIVRVADLEGAMDVARSFPGLAFGADIEVRARVQLQPR